MTETDPTAPMRQKRSRDRRQTAYDIIKNLALEAGTMQHQRDGDGYDEFIGLLESGEFELIFNARQEK